MISLMEEWIFRCALPLWASSFLPYLAGVVLSNALFAIIHYFTLRWKVQRCIFAFLGGMGLSRLLVFEDLFLLIGIHWFATFINTPRPPNGVRS
jgi:di/tricarboxylate transporter